MITQKEDSKSYDGRLGANLNFRYMEYTVCRQQHIRQLPLFDDTNYDGSGSTKSIEQTRPQPSRSSKRYVPSFAMAIQDSGGSTRFPLCVKDARTRGHRKFIPVCRVRVRTGMSRGKERRRTSRPLNLHIWLRVATAPIGIAKSQIGLVRGPTLSDVPTLIPRRRFSWKSIPGKLFVTLSMPRPVASFRALPLYTVFYRNYSTIRELCDRGCLTSHDNKSGIRQMLRSCLSTCEFA